MDSRERYTLVARVLAGDSIKNVACSVGINTGQLYKWVRKYKIYGYNGLIPKQKGRKPKDPDMKKRDRLERRKGSCATQGEKAAIIKELRENGFQLRYLLKAVHMAKSRVSNKP